MKKRHFPAVRVLSLLLFLLMMLSAPGSMASAIAPAGEPDAALPCTAALPAAAWGDIETAAPYVYEGTRVSRNPGATVLPSVGDRRVVTGAAKNPYAGMRLLPGGTPFGLRLHTAGVLVVELSAIESGGRAVRPAQDGGVQVGDVLLRINGKSVSSVEEATALMEGSGGAPLTLTLRRSGKDCTATVTPRKSDADGKYRSGMWLRDTAAGLGTLTFYDPQSGLFGGLGHGVCDATCGALIPIGHGTVYTARVSGAVRGEVGKPGELRGTLGTRQIGQLVTNSPSGVFGVLQESPRADGETLPVAAPDEVHAGTATLYCTLGDGGVEAFTVEIAQPDCTGTGTRSFTVHVTDPALLSRTGGIVQGMSGSPLVQDGRLIGAVTHVLIDDPTSGYGIYIGRMLDNMQMRVAA